MIFSASEQRCMTFDAPFLVDDQFLFTSFDLSNRALPGLSTAAATLPHAVTALQCTVYFTTHCRRLSLNDGKQKLPVNWKSGIKLQMHSWARP